jgi:DNA-binding Lrp family transcriptional regulator
MTDAALEALRRGCLTAGALARLIGVSVSQAGYALRRLWREGAVRRYKLGLADAWCLDAPGAVGIPCGGRVAYISARRIARAALELLRSGARALKPIAVAQLNGGVCGGAHLIIVRGILRAMLGDCAVEDRRSGRHVLLVADPRCAAERLQRVAESGTLPLRPLPPPPPPPPRRERLAFVSVYVPAWMLAALDGLVRRGVFPSRSEAVRAAIRELLKRGGIF